MKRIVILVIVVFLLFFTSTGAAVWQAAFVLPNLVPGTLIHPLDWATAAPEKTAVEIPYAGGTLAADLYTPKGTGELRGAFLLVPGAAALGKDDPRIVNFGETLARTGTAILIPNFPDITATRFTASSTGEVVTAFEYLIGRYPKAEKGIASFSIASGPMFMAAADPSIANNIDYLVSFGGYYDLKDVIQNATVALGRDPTEAAEIRDIFHTVFGADPGLTALLNNTDPGQFEALYDKLSPGVKQFITDMSTDGHLSGVKAPKILLMHSDPDPDVPTAESVKLQKALGSRAELVILKSFSHTDVELEKLTPKTLFTFYIPEISKLYRVAYKVLTF